MAARWMEALTGSLEQKRRYRECLARIEELPQPHRAAAEAAQRYLLRHGPVADGEVLVTMLTDFADLWERAAADGTPLRAVGGKDPVEFVEAFAQAYDGRGWIDGERDRLRKAVAEAERRAGRETGS
ncbi:DUF1048 domain-containing protein [Brevibacterium album]|uniref:DUF1048 domain-containing protein n=1 Tax=Brevibacterium album TaxID=417948 RepID=UPI00041A9018|nr:DUF1048 domain-containing protein [Brevibacterium album]